MCWKGLKVHEALSKVVLHHLSGCTNMLCCAPRSRPQAEGIVRNSGLVTCDPAIHLCHMPLKRLNISNIILLDGTVGGCTGEQGLLQVTCVNNAPTTLQVLGKRHGSTTLKGAVLEVLQLTRSGSSWLFVQVQSSLATSAIAFQLSHSNTRKANKQF